VSRRAARLGAIAGVVLAALLVTLTVAFARRMVSVFCRYSSRIPWQGQKRAEQRPVVGVAVTEKVGQPKPARPNVPTGPAWLRYPSQMNDAEARDLLSEQDKASTVTPGLQSALTAATVVAVLAAIAAVGIFNFSHFRAMDVRYGMDSAGNPTGGTVDYTAWGIGLLAGAGALSALAGVRFDLTARTRIILMTAGSAAMIAVGAGVAVLLDPSRHDLLKYFHVGIWGSRSSFDRLIYVLDACGWLVAGCGVAVLVLMVVQRRRIAVALDT
jgi:hypothetical protein